MAFHRPNSEHRVMEILWWIRRTASLTPIHNNSNVLLSWFTGKEALELESLSNEEIINGFSATISGFLPNRGMGLDGVKFSKVLRSKWGNDPLFLGHIVMLQLVQVEIIWMQCLNHCHLVQKNVRMKAVQYNCHCCRFCLQGR
ncbi:Probable polyamine oxidase 5 [Linum grandiflorum]